MPRYSETLRMSDIVTRLRLCSFAPASEAADEIEWLWAALTEIYGYRWDEPCSGAIAAKALGVNQQTTGEK